MSRFVFLSDLVFFLFLFLSISLVYHAFGIQLQTKMRCIIGECIFYSLAEFFAALQLGVRDAYEYEENKRKIKIGKEKK